MLHFLHWVSDKLLLVSNSRIRRIINVYIYILHTSINIWMRKYTQGLASFDIHWFWVRIETDIGMTNHCVQYSNPIKGIGRNHETQCQMQHQLRKRKTTKSKLLIYLDPANKESNGNIHDPFMVHKTEGLVALIRSGDFDDLPRAEQTIFAKSFALRWTWRRYCIICWPSNGLPASRQPKNNKARPAVDYGSWDRLKINIRPKSGSTTPNQLNESQWISSFGPKSHSRNL